MDIDREYQALAQELLNRHGAQLKVDGIFGPASDAAADLYHGTDLAPHRHLALLIQTEWNLRSDKLGKDPVRVDAWWGPQTQQAADELLALAGKKKLPDRPDDAGQTVGGPCATIRCWTPTTRQMEAAYGSVGSNQVRLEVPYPIVLDWDRSATVRTITLHRKVADSALAAMEEVLEHYGQKRLRELGLHYYGGSLNVRKKRGGSTWSAHAWGTALDWWPSMNQLRWDHRKAVFAKPEYAEWFRIWECHGWMSLGRCYDFDWMHLQRNP